MATHRIERLIPDNARNDTVIVSDSDGIYKIHQERRLTVEINRGIFYRTIDQAAMVAANRIYNEHIKTCNEHKRAYEEEKKVYQDEYGIAIYEVGTKFCLSTTRPNVDAAPVDNKLGRIGEKFVAHVHSHPWLIKQTFSIQDLLTSYKLQCICYLVVGHTRDFGGCASVHLAGHDHGDNDYEIVEMGELMKFEPPKKGDLDMEILKSNYEQIKFKYGLIKFNVNKIPITNIHVGIQDTWQINKEVYEQFKKDKHIIGKPEPMTRVNQYGEQQLVTPDDIEIDRYNNSYLPNCYRVLNAILTRLSNREGREFVTIEKLNRNVEPGVLNIFTYGIKK